MDQPQKKFEDTFSAETVLLENMPSPVATARAPRGNSNIQLDVQLIELELQNLLAEYPELGEDEELRADMVEGSTAAYDVLDRILTKYREAEADKDAAQARIDRIIGRREAANTRSNVMRRLALRLMTAGDLKSVKLPEGTLSRVKGRESVEVVDETALPDRFIKVKTTRTPDKTAIKEMLLTGTEVPGARMVMGDETLQVR